jgi:hypothetical protein
MRFREEKSPREFNEQNFHEEILQRRERSRRLEVFLSSAATLQEVKA